MGSVTEFPLGPHLRYPITITRLIYNPGDEVKKGSNAMEFSYKYKREVGDQITGDIRQEEQTGFASWPCPTNGTLKSWDIRVGQVIPRSLPCVRIEETCIHDNQYGGMCLICGKSTDEIDFYTTQLDTARAPVQMIHDNVKLTVSLDRAAETELLQQKRLLEHRKLSLVVDLDQTIIHACIDPTVGEWQNDPTNPNHDAVKDVQSFQLNDDGPRGMASGCSYYIKMRPNLRQFLANIAKLYELHVYTMGTRAYAMNIARIVDPDKKLFGDRIISRDENGNMTAKSLQRLFPVSTNMVVVIDDRADVWPNNRRNLIKVVPYDFFKGTGDINSSFLPKRQDQTPAPEAVQETPSQNGDVKLNAEGDPAAKATAATAATATAPALAPAGTNAVDEAALLKAQSEEQERALEKQLTDRPLLHMQEKLDKDDEEAEKAGVESESPEGGQTTPSHQRHHVLLDDDAELIYLEKHLTNLHEKYYEAYETRENTRVIPDVGNILDELKHEVLRGTRIVLSGIVPNNVDKWNHEIALQVKSFGAILEDRIHPAITHLVVSLLRPRTAKVREAVRIPTIKIVNQNWLQDSISQWEELDETPYLLDLHPADRGGLAPLVLPGKGEGGNSPEAIDTVMQNGGAGVDELDSADEEDELDPRSPIDELKTFDFDEADEELAAFMEEDDGDEDNEDGNSEDGGRQSDSEFEDNNSTTSETASDTESRASGAKGEAVNGASPGSKRKHGDGNTEGERDVESSGSALAKKLKMSRSQGGSKLRSAYEPESEPQAPTAEATTANGSGGGGDIGGDEDEEVDLLETDGGGNEDLDDIDEADLMAELDKEEQEALAEKG
ncbi:fcp1-like phosphatase [Diaporthe amygdali]|uniref:fcp1-like phosphatase n=1 Tax=Phomopsis amygdali TaxID=1214568 RepID=UPI0022FE2540|nr:fcp1-like phosphatase [Diaporthe amygdali]KAJ0107482.1 fcp1-like phosphatase [Diaporthe amygdali]